ncbi:MAG: acyltransferase [Desulfotomaculaceae bacterium]|nr:acyltransferase [Desulfotomaculaceae bacterium]
MKGKAHIGEVDYLRAFGLIAIVYIHAFGFFLATFETNTYSYIFQELSVNLLRFGRYVFMFVTGLVLFYSYNGYKINTLHFYKHRFKNLVIPYAVWTAVYILIKRWSNMISWPNFAGFSTIWLQNLINGNAFYHLYYIVTTIQFYLFFPLLILIFKPQRPRLWAKIILVGGFLLTASYYYFLEIQVANVINLVAGTQWEAITGLVLQYKDRLLFSYLIFFLLGGLAGLYLKKWRKWLIEHHNLIFGGLILSAGLVCAEYFYFYHQLGWSWELTISVFKPSIYLYSLAIIASLSWLSLFLARRGYMRSLITILAANSLGIYLIHPAVLFIFHSFLWGQLTLLGPFVFILDPAAAIAVSCLITIFFGRNQYTSFITGKAGNLHKRVLWHNLSKTKVSGYDL